MLIDRDELQETQVGNGCFGSCLAMISSEENPVLGILG